MAIEIRASFAFQSEEPCDVLLQFEAADIPEQAILASDCALGEAEHLARIAAQDNIGERIWVRMQGRYEVSYSARVSVDRLLSEIGSLERMEPHRLPGEAVQYLFDSRYCAAGRLQPFAEAEFGGLEGGAKIMAMRDWIAGNFCYTPGSSTSNTTALDSFIERRGICRDYAHVMIALARATAIPARFASVYAPGVDPPDFHAVAEVFLQDPTTPGGGAWHIVDATGMADPAQTVKIGVGRDAADVSFMTSFGDTHFECKDVSVTAG